MIKWPEKNDAEIEKSLRDQPDKMLAFIIKTDERLTLFPYRKESDGTYSIDKKNEFLIINNAAEIEGLIPLDNEKIINNAAEVKGLIPLGNEKILTIYFYTE